jgi:hypothetical protein
LAAGDTEHHFVFDAGKYEFYVATVLTWLGTDDHAAEEHARWVIAECQPGHTIRWPMRLAISQLDLALIKTRHGELDEAVALGNAALRRCGLAGGAPSCFPVRPSLSTTSHGATQVSG